MTQKDTKRKTRKGPAQQKKEDTRREKILNMIGTGLMPQEIQRELKLSKKQYYRDVDHIRDMLLSEDNAKNAVIKIIQQKEDLLRKARLEYTKSSDPNIRAKFLRETNRILDMIEKTYSRMGLIPKDSLKVEHEGVEPIVINILPPKKEKGGVGKKKK